MFSGQGFSIQHKRKAKGTTACRSCEKESPYELTHLSPSPGLIPNSSHIPRLRFGLTMRSNKL